MTDTNSIYNRLGVSDQVLRFGQEVLEGLTDQFRHILYSSRGGLRLRASS